MRNGSGAEPNEGLVADAPVASLTKSALNITAAYWFTSSTSIANPAITVARSLSNSFAGIAPRDVAGFVVAQLFGGAVGAVASLFLFARPPPRTS